MLRKIICIDEYKCNGCGACAAACHEGAIAMVDGVAKLMREDYCDGLGDCLPACPTGAIRFEVREAPAYDEAAVKAAQKKRAGAQAGFACPGSMSRSISHSTSHSGAGAAVGMASSGESRLSQWPVQIKLMPVKAPYYQGARLLIAADCTAYACGNFHDQYIRDHVTVIGCPKLDEGDYREKLAAILTENDIVSVTLVRMEVPCCGGLERAARQALEASGKQIPFRVVVIGTDGSCVS